MGHTRLGRNRRLMSVDRNGILLIAGSQIGVRPIVPVPTMLEVGLQEVQLRAQATAWHGNRVAVGLRSHVWKHGHKQTDDHDPAKPLLLHGFSSS